MLKKGFYVTKRGPISLFNPIITRRSTETFTMWDDCMSFPHLMARVTRHQEIDVKFWTVIHLDDWDKKKKKDVTGGGSSSDLLSVDEKTRRGVVEIEWLNLPQEIGELLQHEIDHLNGKFKKLFRCFFFFFFVTTQLYTAVLYYRYRVQLCITYTRFP